MYAFIVNSTKINFNTEGINSYKENGRLKNLEIEMREKIEKIKNFNPDSCYNFSEIEGEKQNASFNRDFSVLSKYNSSFSNNENNPPNVYRTKNSKKQKKILEYKTIVKWLDIIASFLIILGCIMAQFENEDFYYDNLTERVEVIRLLRDLKFSKGNVSLLDLGSYNLTYLKNQNYNVFINKNENSSVIANALKNESLNANSSENSSENSFINGNDDANLITNEIKNINETTTKNIITTADIFNNNSIYIFLEDYSIIPLNIIISPFCENIRFTIALSTIISIPLIVIGRYFEFMKEYIYTQNLEITFYKSPSIYTMIYELLLITPFNYPNVNSYTIVYELGDYICIPFSSIFSTLTFIRFYFVLKLFKHLTKWTSTHSEHVCEKFVCKADTKFAFKAFQKENPFFILFVIFVSTCLCFGLSLRQFELLYWESRRDDIKFMDWNYTWNAFWCIFVSMTTTGYGDFYSKTQIGRGLTIIACLVGNYFVSMMMVFMTQKSGLNENEKKAYNLITRLKLRNEIKEQHAFIVFNALKMAATRVKKFDAKISEKFFHILYSYEKRNVITVMEIVKNKLKMIETFRGISFKENLFEISERIDADIKEIKSEIEALKFINEILINFSECQVEIVKYLKKNCYATKLLYNIIHKKKIFGDLNNVDQNLKNIFETQLDRNEKFEDDTDDPDEEYEDNIFNYEVNIDQIKNHYEFIFNKNSGKKSAANKAFQTVNLIKKNKTSNNFKLNKIRDKLKMKMSQKTFKKEGKNSLKTDSDILKIEKDNSDEKDELISNENI